MKIFFGQIYPTAGVSFPFSIRFQRWLADRVNEHIKPTKLFGERFDPSFDLGFRISAKKGALAPEVVGPTLFRRDKNVEFSIFLAHQAVDCWDITAAAEKLGELLSAVVGVIEQLGLDGSELRERVEELKQEFIRTPGMLEPAKT